MNKLNILNIYDLQIKCNYDINKDYTIHDLDFDSMYRKLLCPARFQICMRSHNIGDNIIIMDNYNNLFHIFKLKDEIYTHDEEFSSCEDVVEFDQILDDIVYNNDYVFFLNENLTICDTSSVFDIIEYPNKAKEYDTLITKLNFEFSFIS